MLSGKSQSQKTTLCMIPFLEHSGNRETVETSNRSVIVLDYGGPRKGVAVTLRGSMGESVKGETGSVS